MEGPSNKGTKIKNIINSTLNLIKKERIAILSSLTLSIFYIGLILFFTKGRLLYGLDNPGYYSISQALSTNSPTGYFNALSIFLSFGNYYYAFYLTRFIFAFLTLIAVYYLSTEIFDTQIDKKHLPYLGIVTSIIYLFNISVVQGTYITFLGTVSIPRITFIVFLLEAVRFLKASNKPTGKYSNKNAIIMGAALGLSLGFFPNGIRRLIMGLLIFSFLVIYRLILPGVDIKNYLKNVARVSIILIISTVVFSLYLIIPMIQNLNYYLLITKYGAAGFSNPKIFTTTTNILINDLRLLNQMFWLINEVRGIYFSNSLIVLLTTLLIPILALALPILLSTKSQLKHVLPIEVIVLVALFWAKGSNSPLGIIYSFLTSHIPYGLILIQTNNVLFFLPILYSVLIGYSILAISMHIKRHKTKLVKTKLKSTISLLIAVVLILLLLVSVYPAFNGTLEGWYNNQSVGSYFVPSSYQNLQSYLAGNASGVVILPTMGHYIQTSWGFMGVSDIFRALLYPANIYTQSSFSGGYSRFIPADIAEYVNLTTPLKPGDPNFIQVSYSKPVLTGNVALSQNEFILNSSNQSKIQIDFQLNRPIAINRYSYLTLQFNASDQTQFIGLISNQSLQIGLETDQNIGWYTPDYTCLNCYIESQGSNIINVSLLVNQPDKVYTQSSYSASRVTGFLVRFLNNTPQINMTVSYPNLYGTTGFYIDPLWLEDIKQYNVSYILIDKSIGYGALQTTQYVNLAIRYLTNYSYITPAYSSNNFRLYKINS